MILQVMKKPILQIYNTFEFIISFTTYNYTSHKIFVSNVFPHF